MGAKRARIGQRGTKIWEGRKSDEEISFGKVKFRQQSRWPFIHHLSFVMVFNAHITAQPFLYTLFEDKLSSHSIFLLIKKRKDDLNFKYTKSIKLTCKIRITFIYIIHYKLTLRRKVNWCWFRSWFLLKEEIERLER